MATARSLLSSLFRALGRSRKPSVPSPEEAAKARAVERAAEDYRQRQEADERELAWRREEEQQELVEKLQETEIPESSDPALRWAESGAWHEVTSSNVFAIRYDREFEELQVQYLNGDRYGYRPLPMPTAIYIYQAPSTGVAIWDRLRVRGPGNKYISQVPYFFITEEGQHLPGLKGRTITNLQVRKLKVDRHYRVKPGVKGTVRRIKKRRHP